MYFDVVQFLIRTILEHNTFNKQDVNLRIKCINIILNLLSDYTCPNSLLVSMICDFLKVFYESINTWGFDD
jgi:hypothetical protein